ncbi:hypothetical protein ACFYY2_30605 [Streptomyces sp. NPDC001822]|uniref:hypothetical protein n=1 Tax=Streptomyces sp. NPDC001822 TaxID=3364614 RepID=UPI003682F0C4
MKIAKKVAVFAAAAACTGVMFAQPASATQTGLEYWGTQVAVDNNPGNGAKGWVWVYGTTHSETVGGAIVYQLFDGTTHELDAWGGQTASANTSGPIKGFKACFSDISPAGAWTNHCGNWRWLG